MAIGDSRFSRAGVDFATMLSLHGVTVNVTRTVQADITDRDIFGEPQGYSPTTFQATILVSDQLLNELEIIAGGKPKETLMFMVDPGIILQNDEVAYGGHTYKVEQVIQMPLGGTNMLEMCQATREVTV